MSRDPLLTPQRLSRRAFLKSAALAIGAITLPATYTGAVASPSDPVEGIDHLNRAEYEIFMHLAKAALPVEGTPFPTPREVSVMQTLDKALLAGMAPHILAGLKGGIAFFNDGPKVSYAGRTFTQLSLEEARRFCDEWSDAPTPEQRGIVTALKKLIGLSYWANPRTWTTLNYRGAFSSHTPIPALGNAPLPA